MYIDAVNMEKELHELPDGKKSVHSVAERCIIYIILTLMFSGFPGNVLRLFHQDFLNYLKVKLMGSPPLARLSQCS